MAKSLVVIPTYNEKENVEKITSAVLDVVPSLEILIVDDNSPDGTGKMADAMAQRDPRISVLHRQEKSGLGSAYIAGFKHALEQGYDYIFEMDADFSHDPKALPGFLEKIEEYDLVLGSRYIKGVNVVNWPMSRLLLSYFANVYARLVTGLNVRDATGGFKCFRREVLEKIDLDAVQADGYSFQIEMTFKAWKKGFTICEIPIIFVDRLAGTSKMSKKIVREAIVMVWKLRLQSMMGRLR